jgi:thymidylate kinase
MNYKKTPKELMKVINLFGNNKLNYLLFKCEHIFNGENKNLDIIFETNQDYYQAAQLLEQSGFVLRFSEKFERYKTMYCKLIGKKMFSTHLHREIAWHGIKALNKKAVFERKKEVAQGIFIPSKEDSILIHAAHILFENFKITRKEKMWLDLINENGIEIKYIKKQLKKNYWKEGFREVIKINQERNTQLKKSKIVYLWFKKIIFEPLTGLYLGRKLMRLLLRYPKLKRKGYLISFIGTNGTGKSTITKELLNDYSGVTKHLGIEGQYYYYGWNPTFFLTKLISNFLKNKNKKLFQETVLKKISDKNEKFSIKQEMLLLYQFVEFYYRYLIQVRSKLNKNDLVITDRYFYDIYGQYPYAKRSLVFPLLIKLFPKPDFTFLLDAKPEELQKRGKTNKRNQEMIEEIEREVLPLEYLRQQRNNYHALTKKRKEIHIIDTTNKNINHNCKEIMKKTWKKII